MFRLKNIILLIIIIFGLKGFDLIPFGQTGSNALRALAFGLVLVGVIEVKGKSGTKKNFSFLILLFFLGLFFNFILMKFYNGSSTYDSLFVFLNYFGLAFYFLLHKLRTNPIILIKIIKHIALIVVILMLVQLSIPSKPLFLHLLEHESFMGDRGTVRARIPGMAFVVILYFTYIKRYVLREEKKDLLLGFFFLLIPIAQGFRSISLSLLVCTLFIYFLGGKKGQLFNAIYLFAFLCFIGAIAFTQIDFLSSLLDNMISKTDSQAANLESNIRLATWKYYMLDIKKYFWMYFTGNGLKIPFQTPVGLYAVDLGIFGFYTLGGILPTFALIAMHIKGALMARKLKFYIAATFCVYILLNAFFFNAEAFRVGIFYVYSIIFYLIDLHLSDREMVQIIK